MFASHCLILEVLLHLMDVIYTLKCMSIIRTFIRRLNGVSG